MSQISTDSNPRKSEISSRLCRGRNKTPGYVDLVDVSSHNRDMKTLKYIYWQEENMWLGYLEEFPDYITQGNTNEELQESLRDIHAELPSGNIPGVRRLAELHIA